MNTIRIGILGAAGIAPNAIIDPARRFDGAEVVAIAARDRSRAEAYAGEHGIPQVFESYEQLLADPSIDAIYNPTPNGLHGHWTIAAVRAGKHVLCEKPFTANAHEARQVADIAIASGLVVMEAFHYRYHPVMKRMLEIIASGELGTVRHYASGFGGPGPGDDDIRWDSALAGGALMDVGCYPLHLIRSLAGAEPVVTGAVATPAAHLSDPQVDGDFEVELLFANGVTGHASSSMQKPEQFEFARVEGDLGVLEVTSPFLPQYGNRLVVTTAAGAREETASTETSYYFQLEAFARAITSGGPVLTGPLDSIANMEVIDASYRLAGLAVREPSRA